MELGIFDLNRLRATMSLLGKAAHISPTFKTLRIEADGTVVGIMPPNGSVMVIATEAIEPPGKALQLAPQGSLTKSAKTAFLQVNPDGSALLTPDKGNPVEFLPEKSQYPDWQATLRSAEEAEADELASWGIDMSWLAGLNTAIDRKDYRTRFRFVKGTRAFVDFGIEGLTVLTGLLIQ